MVYRLTMGRGFLPPREATQAERREWTRNHPLRAATLTAAAMGLIAVAWMAFVGASFDRWLIGLAIVTLPWFIVVPVFARPTRQ